MRVVPQRKIPNQEISFHRRIHPAEDLSTKNGNTSLMGSRIFKQVRKVVGRFPDRKIFATELLPHPGSRFWTSRAP